MHLSSRLPVALLAIFVTLPAIAATQSVTIFQDGQAPQQVVRPETNAIQNLFTLRTVSPIERVASQVRALLSANKQTFGLLGARSAPAVDVVGSAGYDSGLSVRFEQTVDGIAVDGADLVALTDASGNIEEMNSSLVRLDSIETVPSFSRAEAIQVAAAIAGFTHPDLGESRRDGLRIVRAPNGERALVWQLSIRDLDSGANPVRVRIGAGGAYQGQVIEMISIGHDAMSGKITIYDGSLSLGTPNPAYKGWKVMEDGRVVSRFAGDEARHANANFEKVRGFYASAYGRSSWDDQGGDLNAAINANRFMPIDLSGIRENAAWMGPWKMFAFGAGGPDLGSFTAAIDVVGHEFTHAVVQATCELEYGGQSGALNEHLADLFGSMIQTANEPNSKWWLIGETVLRGRLATKAEALRNMLDPHLSLGKQPAHMSEIPAELGPNCQPTGQNDQCGVHGLNGIPNRALALIVQKYGFTPELRGLFYRVMTARLRPTSDFKDYRNQMVAECSRRLDAGVCQTVQGAFSAVGL